MTPKFTCKSPIAVFTNGTETADIEEPSLTEFVCQSEKFNAEVQCPMVVELALSTLLLLALAAQPTALTGGVALNPLHIAKC
ncbi:MAG: hypothetical protein IPF52_16595 [Saprospiraceae bacterium]|nr:hypothetical protein [Saprospiraceae bacterium]